MQDKHERARDFIKRLAESKGVRYSLTPTTRNEAELVALWDACTYDRPLDELREHAISVLEASIISEMQGMPFPEPTKEDMQHLQQLFSYPSTGLFYKDRPYRPHERRAIEIEVEVVSDDDEILKLTPMVQLELFGEQNESIKEVEQ